MDGIPRPLEATAAAAGLIIALPVLAFSALAVMLTSRGPALFRQERVGRGGRTFTLYKLRTMRASNGGPQVTARGDNRITAVGKLLRRTKLDELPELWNILKGDMSFVGPRPEVPKYVDLKNPLWRRTLESRPGLTDPVTLRLRNEEDLLSLVGGDRDQFYREILQPFKLRGYVEYLERRSFPGDLSVLWKTAVAIFFPEKAPPPTVNELLSTADQPAEHGLGSSGI
jgi:lipopolysaccharide/colanic/teichoic acid biosynthesis glycosyltransferase